MNPYQVVKDFENALCEYTGAKYAVTTTSCSMALLLICAYYRNNFGWAEITIPKRTYISVPMAIKHAGHRLKFKNIEWQGSYQLDPFLIYDYARFFTSNMYAPNTFQCVSFHWTKTLAIGQGGAILHDDDHADEWLRKARFDGRTEGVPPKEDNIDIQGFHCYMSPRDAAEGLSRIAVLPKYNRPLPNDDYPDLSEMRIFK